MKKIYYLSTCNTCKRILQEIQPDRSVELQDIKTNKITPEQLETLVKPAGSYEALFNKKAIKYRSMGLNTKTLSEEDYKKLILQEYTFLKRPVIVANEEIFIGNAKKVVAAAKKALS